MGFKSGLFPGQSIVLIFFVFKNSLTIFDLWHGAMCNCSVSCNISRCLAPFMVVPFGRKKSPAVPFDDIAPHIITLGGCFIVATVYRSSKRVPTGLRTCCLRVPNCWIREKNFSPLLFTPISIFNRKYHSFSLHRFWCFRWFMRFETKFVHQTSTYSGAMNIRTFQKQRWPYLLTRTRRTANRNSSNQMVITWGSFYPHTSHRFWILQLLDAQLFCYTPPFH